MTERLFDIHEPWTLARRPDMKDDPNLSPMCRQCVGQMEMFSEMAPYRPSERERVQKIQNRRQMLER